MLGFVKIFKNETKKIFGLFTNSTFLYLTVIGNIFLILATVLVYLLEKEAPHSQIHSYFDSLWWGISTITTVAYGDILPQTFAGRLIGIVLMYTGTVMFVSFTGVLLSIMMGEEVEEEIAPLKKSMIIEEQEQARIENILQQILQRLDRLEKR